MGNEMICSDIKDMDIKLGGREMATVVYSNEEDDMCSLVIDGEEYVEDEEQRDFLELFSLISLLSFDVYMKKNMIETLIDDYSSKHIKDNKSNEKDNKK